MLVILWRHTYKFPNIHVQTPANDEVYSIRHYVIKFVSDLRQVGGFSPGIPVSSTNTTGRHDITEISLKVALNTITLTLIPEAIIWFKS